MRVTPRDRARPQVVEEGILAGCGNVGVVLEVEGGAEERVRIERLRRPAREIVRDGIEVALKYVGSLRCVGTPDRTDHSRRSV